VTFVEDLMALAAELKGQLQLYRKNTPAKLSADIYSKLADTLDRKREQYEAEPILQKGEPSARETVRHMTGAMEWLADEVKELAELRQAYVAPKGPGSLASAKSDLDAMREAHGVVKRDLNELVAEIEETAKSVARYTGALNSNQQVNEERSYRAVLSRAEGEYRRGLRRSG
jgi:hypothetical protein